MMSPADMVKQRIIAQLDPTMPAEPAPPPPVAPADFAAPAARPATPRTFVGLQPRAEP